MSAALIAYAAALSPSCGRDGNFRRKIYGLYDAQVILNYTLIFFKFFPYVTFFSYGWIIIA